MTTVAILEFFEKEAEDYYADQEVEGEYYLEEEEKRKIEFSGLPSREAPRFLFRHHRAMWRKHKKRGTQRPHYKNVRRGGAR